MPEHAGRVSVCVVAVQPDGRLVSVKSNVSDASPVFMTGNVIDSAVSIVTSVTVVDGSTSTPGPRTSKNTRTTSDVSPMARTATFDGVPSDQVRTMVRWGVE